MEDSKDKDKDKEKGKGKGKSKGGKPANEDGMDAEAARAFAHKVDERGTLDTTSKEKVDELAASDMDRADDLAASIPTPQSQEGSGCPAGQYDGLREKDKPHSVLRIQAEEPED